jgi:N-acyl-D-amino-acid deacylase
MLYLRRSLTEHFDVLVVGGIVIDGTGAPGRPETVGVRGGKIVAVKWPRFAQADRIIDARGLIVSPGFIDVHTHIEGNVTGGRKGNPLLTPNFIAQGTTTIITGNCGRSATSLSQFYSQLQSQGMQINIGSLVGHNTVRRQVMGEASRTPTEGELRRMCEAVARAMQDGALGLSTGLEYTPGAFANQNEIQALATIAARYHGIYATHMRDEGNGVVRSLEEAISIAREAHIPVQVSHLKWRGRVNWGRAQLLIDMIEEARKGSLDIRCDIYPYTASSTTLDLLISKGAREGGIAKLRDRLRDAAERRHIVSGILDLMKSEGWTDFAFARVANCDFAPDYNGLTIPEITELLRRRQTPVTASEKRGQTSHIMSVSQTGLTVSAENKSGENKAGSGSGQKVSGHKAIEAGRTAAESQAEAICYLASRGSVQMIYENMSEDDVARILQFPGCMMGSDSGIRNGEGRPHPRGYGSAPRLLSQFAIKRRLFSLEEAVRRMTSLPAETFAIRDRGKLVPGYYADLVIFDPSRVKDEASYDNPFRAPEGIAYVVVNGNVALDHGQITSTNSGQIIRRGF